VTIPSHLLTVEAMEIYLRHLADDGVIAFHVSNPYLDLAPVVRGLARRYGLNLLSLGLIPEDDDVLEASTWMLLTRSERLTEHLKPFALPETEKGEVIWTDEVHDLARLLRWD
jgi:hypothetical protein